MKLQKLIIHNIASIEDATIDFEAHPLSDSEVFLITGKTGSGKSTILDAICLALYGDTPRLKNSLMSGETADASDMVGVKDTRQLLRRNKGEGSVTLTFIGADNIGYIAEWSVWRARNKVNGRLQNDKRSITNLKTGKIYTKKSDLDAIIADAIGLDFNQFCRTTILAQGEFTRFLNSNDTDKATILEKITGVDIYTKIGRKIFELTMQHKQKYEDAKHELDGVKILTDEEVAAKKDEIKALRDQADQADKSKAQVDEKLRWLTDEVKLQENIAKASANLAKANEQLTSDDFLKKSALIKDWSETIDARKFQSEVSAAVKRQKELTEKISLCKQEFENLRNGMEWRVDQQARLSSELRALKSELDAEKKYAAIYNNVQTIAEKVDVIKTSRFKIDASLAQINVAQEQLDTKFTKDFAEVNSVSTKLKEGLDKQKQLLDELQRGIDMLHVDKMRENYQRLVEDNGYINLAKAKLEAMRREEERVSKMQAELSQQAQKIAELAANVKTLASQLAAADERAKLSRELFEKQMQTVNDWAKGMRNKLKIGDTCPVCGKPVEAALPDESEFAKLYQLAEEAYNSDRDKAEQLRQEHDRVAAEVKASQANYDARQKALSEDKTAQTLKDELNDLFEKMNIHDLEKGLEEALKFHADEVVVLLASSKKLLDGVAEKEADIKHSRELYDEQYAKYLQLCESKNAVEKAISECENLIKHERNNMKERQLEFASASAAVQNLLSDSRWRNTWQDDYDAFVTELNATAQKYAELVEKVQLKERELADCKQLKEQEDDAHQKIMQVLPDSVALTFSLPQEVPNLLSKLNSLFADLKSAQDGIEEAKRNQSRSEMLLAEFLLLHTEVSMARLAELASITAETIERHRNSVDKTRSKVQDAQTQVNALKEQMEEHTQAKPDFGEDETSEALKANAAQFAAIAAQLREKAGGINHELQQDEANKRNRRDLISEIERLKAVYERWMRLNELIGCREGKKFRTVAQSYILGSLIHHANRYMHTLTDRYTLTVTPGTFVISLEDAYNGYTRRAATTISGGESFLVSLALALALADIGKQLAVDTMFIDEGFGTLSGEPLRRAVDTLRSLHSTSGRHVGIISHVEELRERIPVQIQVNQEGNNSSSQIQVITL
jgi:exonuclease SbcC